MLPDPRRNVAGQRGDPLEGDRVVVVVHDWKPCAEMRPARGGDAFFPADCTRTRKGSGSTRTQPSGAPASRSTVRQCGHQRRCSPRSSIRYAWNPCALALAAVFPAPKLGTLTTIAVLSALAGMGRMNCTTSGVTPTAAPAGIGTWYVNVLVSPVIVTAMIEAPVAPPPVTEKPVM